MQIDYISREDAINFFEHMTWYHVNRRGQLVDGANSDTGLYKAKDVYKGLHDISAADVVPVVRCRDCAKLNRNGYCTRFQNNISGIATSWFMPDEDDFCSYGERKE